MGSLGDAGVVLHDVRQHHRGRVVANEGRALDAVDQEARTRELVQGRVLPPVVVGLVVGLRGVVAPRGHVERHAGGPRGGVGEPHGERGGRPDRGERDGERRDPGQVLGGDVRLAADADAVRRGARPEDRACGEEVAALVADGRDGRRQTERDAPGAGARRAGDRHDPGVRDVGDARVVARVGDAGVGRAAVGGPHVGHADVRGPGVGHAGVDGGRAGAHTRRAGLPGGARTPARAAVGGVGQRVGARAAAEGLAGGAGAGARDARLAGGAAVAARAAVGGRGDRRLAPADRGVAVGEAGAAGEDAGRGAARRGHVELRVARVVAAAAVVRVGVQVDAAAVAGERRRGAGRDAAAGAVARLAGRARPPARAAVSVAGVNVDLAPVGGVAVAVLEARGAAEAAARVVAARRDAVGAGRAGVAAAAAVTRVGVEVDLAAVRGVAVAVVVAERAVAHRARAGAADRARVGERRAGVAASAAVEDAGVRVGAGAAALRPGDGADPRAAPEHAHVAPRAGAAARAAVGALGLGVDAAAAAAVRAGGADVALPAAVVAVGVGVDLAAVGRDAVEIEEAHRAAHHAAAVDAAAGAVRDGHPAGVVLAAAVGGVGARVDLAAVGDGVREVAVDVDEVRRAGVHAAAARAGDRGVGLRRAGVAAAAAVRDGVARVDADRDAGALGGPGGAVEHAARRRAAGAGGAGRDAAPAVEVVLLQVEAAVRAARLPDDAGGAGVDADVGHAGVGGRVLGAGAPGVRAAHAAAGVVGRAEGRAVLVHHAGRAGVGGAGVDDAAAPLAGARVGFADLAHAARVAVEGAPRDADAVGRPRREAGAAGVGAGRGRVGRDDRHVSRGGAGVGALAHAPVAVDTRLHPDLAETQTRARPRAVELGVARADRDVHRRGDDVHDRRIVDRGHDVVVAVAAVRALVGADVGGAAGRAERAGERQALDVDEPRQSRHGGTLLMRTPHLVASRD